MPRIFGRRARNTCTLERELSEWESSSEDDKRALAINLRSDHRITPNRGTEFTACFMGDSLKDALIDYCKERSKLTAAPDFILPRLNRKNYVFGFPKTKNLIGKNEYLVNVLNLNGLRIVFDACADQLENFGFVDTNGFERPNTDELNSDRRFGDWLNRMLEGASQPKCESFLKATFGLMNYQKNEKKASYNAVWVSKWDDFEPFLAGNADQWVQVLGVKQDPRNWQILLRYPAKVAKMIVRPTQLEGGYYKYHFPTPTNAPKNLGGHPMHLGTNNASGSLLPEFVHIQVDYDIHYWIDGGRRMDRTSGKACKFDILRHNHYELLVTKYGAPVRLWMPSAM